MLEGAVDSLTKMAELDRQKTPKKSVKRIGEIVQLERMAREVFGTRAKINGDENSGKLILSYSSFSFCRFFHCYFYYT